MSTTATPCLRCGTIPLPDGTCQTCLLADLAGADADPFFAADPAGDGEGSFTILSLLGRGGMGQVFRARQASPAREIAVKMLAPQLAASPECRRRLVAEANAMSELDHPAILPVYGAGEMDGLPWFTMRLVEGGTLAARVDTLRGAWRDIAALLATVADAVQHAHQRGVLHRDLKPGNILFDSAGHPFVSDFGLAKLAFVENNADQLTHSAQLLGTPGYMAPEIAGGSMKAATTASDVYALGAILYELLCGVPPFAADSVQSLLRKIVEADPLPLEKKDARIPRDLAAIAHRAMEKRPAARYDSAATFAADLRAWLEGKPVTARVIGTAGRLARWARRRPAVAALSGTLVLGTLSGGILLWRAYQQETKARASAEELAFTVGDQMNRILPTLGRPTTESEFRESVTAYYERTPERTDGDFLRRKSEHYRFTAEALAEVGDPQQALRNYETAVDCAQRAASLSPDSFVVRRDLCLALSAQFHLRTEQQASTADAAEQRHILRQASLLADRYPQEIEAHQLFITVAEPAVTVFSTADLLEERKALYHAIRSASARRVQLSENGDERHRGFKTHDALLRAGETATVEAWQEAVSVARQAVVEVPVWDYQVRLADALKGLVNISLSSNDWKAAAKYSREHVEILQKVLLTDELRIDVRNRLAAAQRREGEALRRDGEHDAAVATLEQSVSHYDQILIRYPQSIVALENKCWAMRELLDLYRFQKLPLPQEQWLQRLVPDALKLMQVRPGYLTGFEILEYVAGAEMQWLRLGKKPSLEATIQAWRERAQEGMSTAPHAGWHWLLATVHVQECEMLLARHPPDKAAAQAAAVKGGQARIEALRDWAPSLAGNFLAKFAERTAQPWLRIAELAPPQDAAGLFQLAWRVLPGIPRLHTAEGWRLPWVKAVQTCAAGLDPAIAKTLRESARTCLFPDSGARWSHEEQEAQQQLAH